MGMGGVASSEPKAQPLRAPSAACGRLAAAYLPDRLVRPQDDVQAIDVRDALPHLGAAAARRALPPESL